MGAWCAKSPADKRQLVVTPIMPGKPAADPMVKAIRRNTERQRRVQMIMNNALQKAARFKHEGKKTESLHHLRVVEACRAAQQKLAIVEASFSVSTVQGLTVDAMRDTAAVIKRQEAEDVYGVVDIFQEAVDSVRHVSEAIVAPADDEDDADLELEFQALELEQSLPAPPEDAELVPGQSTGDRRVRKRGEFRQLVDAE